MIDPALALAGAVIAVVVATVAYSIGVADRPYTDPPEPYTFTFAPQFVAPAWRATHPDAIELPVAVLLAYADPSIVNRHLERDRDKIDRLTESLAAEGQLEPFKLCVDGRGRAVLDDGYHRAIALTRLGVRTAGVTLTRSPRIPGWGRPVSDLFTDLAGDLRWRPT